MKLILLAALASLPALAHQHGLGDTLVRLNATENVKSYLRAHDLDVTGVNINAGTLEVLVTADQLAELQALKAQFRFGVPKTLLRGPDPEYFEPSEIEAALKRYAQDYPELTQLRKIGESLEKRPIWAIKISDNAAQRELAEPVILFNGMHHAREVMTPEVTMDVVDYLLSNYKSDAKVQAWVDANEIWVVPMFNVDGNQKVWGGDSMWRKNTRDGHGVDLNRNYPTGWKSCNGSSGSTFSQTYRGPQPASEPETQVMMSFVTEIRPVFNISYHAYSELVLYPYGCRPSRVPTAAVVERIGKEMGTALNYKPGTPWELLYNADGGDIDWMYQEMQVIPYVIEVSSDREGFQPDYAQWRNKTVERNRAGWQLILNRASASGVRGKTATANEIDVRDGQDKLIQTYKVNPDGTYHIVLNPGSYKLTYRSGTRVLQTATTVIADKRIDL
jgi:carboxypeptidase T